MSHRTQSEDTSDGFSVAREFRKKASLVLRVSCLVWVAFYALDLLIYAKYWLAFLIIRAAIALLFVLSVYLCKLPLNTNATSLNISMVIITANIGISFMIYLTDGIQSAYFAGLMIPLIGGALGNPFFVKHHLFTGTATLMAYVIAIYLHDPQSSWQRLLAHCFFIVATMTYVAINTKLAINQRSKRIRMQDNIRSLTKLLSKKNRDLNLLYAQAKKDSQIDALTGTFNRKYFLNILTRKMDRIKDSNLSFYLALSDIDHFKKANDKLGHPYGDKLLQDFCHIANESFGGDCVLGRFGGDEFLLIIDMRDEVQLEKTLQTIRENLQAQEDLQNQEGIIPNFSMGIVKVSGRNDFDGDGLIEMADRVLYDVKREQRGNQRILDLTDSD